MSTCPWDSFSRIVSESQEFPSLLLQTPWPAWPQLVTHSSLDVPAAFLLLDLYPWPMASVGDCHLSELQMALVSPFHRLILPLPGYSYLFKPDPPGSQISGIMHCEPTWNELRRKLLVSVTCKTTAPALFTFESKHCLGISLVGN